MRSNEEQNLSLPETEMATLEPAMLRFRFALSTEAFSLLSTRFVTHCDERIYEDALLIQHGERIGAWLPKIWHLAARGHSEAMVELADWLSENNSLESFGKTSDAFSPAGLYYRAYRRGIARAAYNVALSCFNRSDMAGYRLWLRRAAVTGDGAAKKELNNLKHASGTAPQGKLGAPDQNQSVTERINYQWQPTTQ